jgi:gliding motility-associated protein GldM
MIGLMYLVLTALLAMNVSKDILKAFVTVNENLERTNENFNNNTARVLKAFEEAAKSNPSALPYLEKAKEVNKLTKEVFEHIDKLKQYLIDEVEKSQTKDTATLKFANAKDNYDDPTRLMIGDDETKPKDGEWSAVDLRKRFDGLHDKLLAMLESMQKNEKTKLLPEDFQGLKEKISTLKIKDPTDTEDGIKVTWEIFNFYHLPLAGVVTNLSQMQSDLKNVESELIANLAGASGKLSIKFNQYSAVVVAPSSYIQAGDKYTADIFIGASSTDFKAENLQIMIGVDSAAAAGGAKGTEVPIVNGVGKYEVGTSGQGDQEYQGVIKLKKPTGEYSYFPFKREYKVAPPSGTVSADMMNVFYVGVDNPVTAQAAGIAPADVTITPSGCGVTSTSKGAGKYNLRFTSPGECSITVMGKNKDGSKPQGPALKFKVKPLPKPELKIAGKFSPLDLPKASLFSVGALVAGASGFDFAANYVTQSWSVYGKVKGKVVSADGNGPNLSAEATNIFKNCDAGSKILIDARVKGPDGNINSASCGIKVNK